MSTRTAGWLWVAGQFTALGVLLFLPWRTPNPLLLSIGAVVALGGGFLGLATSRALGEAFTPSPVPIAGSGLRTTGVYSVIRHPMYAAVLLIVIGVLIAAGSIWGWAWGVVIAVFFLLKSRWEDALLRSENGASWEEWAEVTGALVPRTGLRGPDATR